MHNKVKQIPAYEQVFTRLKEAIKNKEWQINEKIPSEADLSALYGVNRLTVRMALQRLTGMGLLEARTGNGTYVKEFNFRNYIERVSDFYLNPELFDKIWEFRLTIELACVKLAIERATEEELDELEVICTEFDKLKYQLAKKYSEELFSSLVEKDLQFHHKICAMSHNDLFEYTFEIARAPIYQYLRIILNKRIEKWKEKGIDVTCWNDLHREIYSSIRDKDFERCQMAYQATINYQVEL